jgi:predicted O-methyltransferase YrrM
MNKLLKEIFEKKEFLSENNEIIKIHSETSKEQCEFLQNVIRENNFKKSIEIGFAFGMSTLAITEEIVNNGGSHLVIDKFQYDGWGGYGLELIKRAGYSDKIEFYEDYCCHVLPDLLKEGRKFDFAYIDSTKQIDWLMVNFFYLDKLLEINGIIVFDDVVFPSIRKLLRYIVQIPCYKVYAVYPENYNVSLPRKISQLFKRIPKSDKILKEEITTSDSELGINTNCVAIQKISVDDRNWDWHVSF